MKYRFVKKPASCPVCGSEKVARIFYGMPMMSDKLRREIDEGRIVLGGCVVREPVWKCTKCGLSIYKIEIDIEGSTN